MLTPDVIRLPHMREAAAYAQEMAAAHTRSDLDENVMLRMALTHCLEILGEADSRVTPETRAQLSIPFAQMVAMRHRLIHAYLDVDLDIIWTTVVEDLPSLLTASRRHSQRLSNRDFEIDRLSASVP
jgi:uncharacterized protein with HEPN domain